MLQERRLHKVPNKGHTAFLCHAQESSDSKNCGLSLSLKAFSEGFSQEVRDTILIKEFQVY
jgi:hypothetical protein